MLYCLGNKTRKKHLNIFSTDDYLRPKCIHSTCQQKHNIFFNSFYWHGSADVEPVDVESWVYIYQWIFILKFIWVCIWKNFSVIQYESSKHNKMYLFFPMQYSHQYYIGFKFSSIIILCLMLFFHVTNKIWTFFIFYYSELEHHHFICLFILSVIY